MEEIDRKILINSFEGIKSKLLNVINLKQFCGLCMEYCSEYIPTETRYNFVCSDEEKILSLNEIISYLFHGENVISSSLICNKCIEKVLQSYMFINEIKKISKIIGAYTNDLCSKVGDISHHVDTSMEIENSNVVIVIESNEAENMFKLMEETNFGTLDVLKNNNEFDNPIRVAVSNEVEIGKKNKKNDLFLCEHCYKMFPTEKGLMLHSKTHFRVRCKICQLVIPRVDLLLHMKSNHKSKTHSCTLCKSSTAYDFNSISKNKETHCLMCFNKYKSDELKNHECQFRCTVCQKIPCIHHKYLISYREQIVQKSKAKCMDCDYHCADRNSLIGHVNRNHLNYKPYQCDYCGQNFYDKIDLKAHIIRSHQESYVCKNCELNLKDRTSFQNHLKCCIFTDREFKCFECSCSFNSIEELTHHIGRRHKSNAPCNDCKKRCPDKKKSGNNTNNKTKSVMKLVCPLCDDIKFDDKEDFDEHITSHGPNIKYPCKICNINFRSIKLLHVHNNTHHATVLCSICTKEISKKNYKAHVKSCTKKHLVYNCSFCGKCFKKKTWLSAHSKIHLIPVPCKVCSKLIKPYDFENHMKSHGMKFNPKDIPMTNPKNRQSNPKKRNTNPKKRNPNSRKSDSNSRKRNS